MAEPAVPVDVLVIGAGATGLATARELARSGRRPLVLERHEPGHDRGSSHGPSRIVRLAHGRTDDVHDAVAALELWRRLEHDTATPLLRRVGGLDLGWAVPAIAEALACCGVAHDVLEPEQVRRRFPGIAPGDGPALYQPDAGVALAEQVLATLTGDALAHGAQIRTGVAVTGIEPGEEHVTVRAAGTVSGRTVRFRADAAVLAAGAWSAGLAAHAGVELPAVATLQSPARYRLRDPGAALPTVIEEKPGGLGYYVLPEHDEPLVKGGVHHAGPVADLAGHRKPDAAQVAEFSAWLAERVPAVDPVPVQASGCVYTWLPESRFHLARHGRLVVASCCSGRGFKFTPLTGQRAAALAREILTGTGVRR